MGYQMAFLASIRIVSLSRGTTGRITNSWKTGRGKAFRYSAPPVEIGGRLVGQGFFASIAYVPSIITESTPTPPDPDIPTEADPHAEKNPRLKDPTRPTPKRPDCVENGHVVGRAVGGTSAIYLSDCTFAPNSGGCGCFFLCLEQATGHSAYSQRVLLSAAMTDADLELYHAIRTQCEAELASSL